MSTSLNKRVFSPPLWLLIPFSASHFWLHQKRPHWALLAALVGSLLGVLRSLYGPLIRSRFFSKPTLPSLSEEAGPFWEKHREAFKPLKADHVFVRRMRGHAHAHSVNLGLSRFEIRISESDASDSKLKEAILAHELAHLQRNDPLRAVLFEYGVTWVYFVCLLPIILFWHPFVFHPLRLAAGAMQIGVEVESLSVQSIYMLFITGCAVWVVQRVRTRHVGFHHDMEFSADRHASRVLAGKVFREALGKLEATGQSERTIPFSSHPPLEDRLRSLEMGQFNNAGDVTPFGYMRFFWTLVSLFSSGMLLVLVYAQVLHINQQLAGINAVIGQEKGRFDNVAHLLQNLENRLEESRQELGLESLDGGPAPDAGLAALNSELSGFREDLDHSHYTMNKALDMAQSQLGLNPKDNKGAVPELKQNLNDFGTSLTLASSETVLGLPSLDGGVPPGGLLFKVMNSSRNAQAGLEQVPQVLGLLPDGGMGDGGPLPDLAESAKNLSSAMEEAGKTLVKLKRGAESGTCPKKAADLKETDLENLSLEQRLACIDELSLAILKLEQVRYQQLKNAPPVTSSEPPDGSTQADPL